MKKLVLIVLLLVGMAATALAITVHIQLSCGRSVATDSSCFENEADWVDFLEVMEEYYCE